MKIIDAVWEQRNLGVTCYEVRLENNDNLKDVIVSYKELQEKQYMVVKVPSSRFDLSHYIQKQGYEFIEAAITLKHDLKQITIPDRLMRVCEKCTWERMNESDLQTLSNEVKKKIFKTDRIYIDPRFTEEQAARRYDLWIKDLVKKGDVPYKVIYDKNVVGFFLNKEIEPDIYDGLLAATYSAYEGTGMGYCVQYAGIQSAADKGAKGYMGHISGNNPAVLRVLLSLGFSIKGIEYIYIKHNEGE